MTLSARDVMFGFTVAITTTAAIFVAVPLAQGGTEALRRRAPFLLRLFIVGVLMLSALSVVEIALPDVGRAMPFIADFLAAGTAGVLLIRTAGRSEWSGWRTALLFAIFTLAAIVVVVNAVRAY